MPPRANGRSLIAKMQLKSVPPEITICVCTRRRREQLLKLLQAVSSLERGQLTFDIVVCENDDLPTAKSVVDEWRLANSVAIKYVQQAVPNISLSRNAAIDCATGKWIAMIDDDEWPASDWLLQMYSCAVKHEADAIFGPVMQIFERRPLEWIAIQANFKPIIAPTGTAVQWNMAATGNALIRRQLLLNEVGAGNFDPRYGNSGGEDTALFARMIVRDRMKVVWCAEAVCYETVPPDRCTVNWLVRRALRSGQLSGVILRTTQSRFRWTSLYLAHLAAAPLSLVMAAALFLLRPAVGLRLAMFAARQIGHVASIQSRRIEEYK
jgi:succinoglycan biosynthesis protein ExoM